MKNIEPLIPLQVKEGHFFGNDVLDLVVIFTSDFRVYFLATQVEQFVDAFGVAAALKADAERALMRLAA